MRKMIAVSLLFAGLVSLARADSFKSDEAAARRHYVQGMAAYDKGDYRSARDEFLSAYRADPQENSLLFNIAQTFRLDREDASALVYYDRYVRFEPTGIYVSLARSRIRELSEAMVTAQAEREARSEQERLRQEQEQRVRRTVERERAREVSVRLTREADHTGSRLRTGGLALAGAGAVALGVGVVLGASDHRFSLRAVAIGTGGLAAAALGGVLYHVGSRRRDNARARAAKVSLIAPTVSDRGVGLSWLGTF